jgi:hypothetical protein
MKIALIFATRPEIIKLWPLIDILKKEKLSECGNAANQSLRDETPSLQRSTKSCCLVFRSRVPNTRPIRE